MINHDHKFIFIHINKTGGASIKKFFDPRNNTTGARPPLTRGALVHKEDTVHQLRGTRLK
jgi:hypothetical protein